MRIIRIDYAERELRVEPHSLEDLWLLAKLLEPGDRVEGRSFRTWRPPGREGRPGAAEKKAVKLLVEVESVEFAEAVNKLRVTGVIRAGHPEEYVSTGEHHTLDVEPRTAVTIRKKELTPYHRKLLEEAGKRARAVNALILAMDEKKATAARLTNRGIEWAFEIESEADKRLPSARFEELQKKYYAELQAALERDAAVRVVIAGPGFAAEDFKKHLARRKPELLEKASFEHCSTAERSGILELLKQGLLQRLLGELRLEEEFKLLEELKMHLGKGDGLAVYGWAAVEPAVQARAAHTLLILDELLRVGDSKAGRTREDAGALVEQAERGGARLLIFEGADDAGREFKGFKLAALLRYRTSYE
jgi:protein pelota